jgi:hypothetical protein
VTAAHPKPQVRCPTCRRLVKADRMWGQYQDAQMRRPVRHKRELVTGQLGDWCEPRAAWREPRRVSAEASARALALRQAVVS